MFREATDCIYRKGVEKPVAKWSFLSNIPSKQKDQPEPSLKTFICEFYQAWPLIKMSRFGNTYEQSFSQLQTTTTAEPDYSKGRVFAVDTQEQFFIALTQAFQRS